MRSTILIAILTAALPAANAVGIYICREGRWGGPCKTVTAGIGQCIWVGRDYNDHVYSAKALPGQVCDSYNNVINGACSGRLVSNIDEGGYSGLPNGHRTSGFACRNA